MAGSWAREGAKSGNLKTEPFGIVFVDLDPVKEKLNSVVLKRMPGRNALAAGRFACASCCAAGRVCAGWRWRIDVAPSGVGLVGAGSGGLHGGAGRPLAVYWMDDRTGLTVKRRQALRQRDGDRGCV
ncbi:hypothetical protein V4890_07850 [Ralstonia solanacearum species complex bacterium KE056]|uniref:hypothetical protein n=1 Tax=Ralstonia solanacearum species complex bacterium KE056 TaxID=3119585 RepID=UPI002FC2D3E2